MAANDVQVEVILRTTCQYVYEYAGNGTPDEPCVVEGRYTIKSTDGVDAASLTDQQKHDIMYAVMYGQVDFFRMKQDAHDYLYSVEVL